MRRTEYVCDLCGYSITELNHGVGFEFKSANTELEHNSVEHCDHHLCLKCISAVHSLSTRLKSEGYVLN